MTTIDNTSAARPIDGTAWSPEAGLTAEGVMAYCASRLNSLDTLIQSRFADQQKRNTALKEAGGVIARLNYWTGIGEGEGMDATNQANHKAYAADFAGCYNQTTDPQVRAKIADAYKILTGKDLVLDGTGKAAAWQLDKKQVQLELSGIHAKSPEQWQGIIGGVKAVQDGLTKDSEMSMIQLQSVVSQRQLAVQMTTQLMQTMHESSKSVVANIR
jgi:hypothetical protein